VTLIHKGWVSAACFAGVEFRLVDPEGRRWRGFARLMRPRLARANLGHPYRPVGGGTSGAAPIIFDRLWLDWGRALYTTGGFPLRVLRVWAEARPILGKVSMASRELVSADHLW
jgi:hypothetical protein